MTPSEPPPRRPLPPPDDESMRDFEQVERITERVVHWAGVSLVVGLPVWLVLLLLVPRIGLGAIGSLSLSTLVATALVVGVERVRRPKVPDAEPVAGAAPRAKAPMTPLRAVLMTLGAVVLFVYAIFIITILVRGG